MEAEDTRIRVAEESHVQMPLLPEPQEDKPKRSLQFIHNIRTFLTFVVVLHHLFIAYGAIPKFGFVFEEDPSPQDSISLIINQYILGPLLLINQSYFMTLFFILAGFFTPSSFNKKGTRKFLWDRFVRLGIPLIVCCFLLEPLYRVYVYNVGFHLAISLGDIYYYFAVLHSFGFTPGPAWFLEVLLVFSVGYAVWRGIRSWCTRPSVSGMTEESVMDPPCFQPSVHQWKMFFKYVPLACLCIGVVAFLVRIGSPVGVWAPYINIMGAYTPTYIAGFSFGIYARSNPKVSRYLASIGIVPPLCCSIILLACFAIVFGPPYLYAAGGWSGNAAFSGLWESALGVCLCVLVTNFWWWKSAPEPSKVTRYLNQNVYTVYIIHEGLIALFGVLFLAVPCATVVKLLIVSPLVLGVSFVVSSLLRCIPGFRRVLG